MKCVPHESHMLKRTAPSLPGGTSAIFTFPSQLCNHVVRWGKVTTILFDAHRGISSLNVFPHAFLSNKKITCLSWAHRFSFLLHLHPMFFILHGLRRSYWHVLLVRTMCSCVCMYKACCWLFLGWFQWFSALWCHRDRRDRHRSKSRDSRGDKSVTIQAPGEPLLDTESTRGDDRVSRLTLHFYLIQTDKKNNTQSV